MKKYIKPAIKIYHVAVTHMLASSTDPDVKFQPGDETNDNEVKEFITDMNIF